MQRRRSDRAPVVVVLFALLAAMSCSHDGTALTADQRPAATPPIEWLWPKPSGTQLNAIAIGKSGTVVVAGEFGTLAVTDDQGQSWTTVEVPRNISLKAATWVSREHVAVVGAAGSMLESRDAGASWSPRAVPVVTDLRAVAFAGSSLGLIAGADGVVLRTEDAGVRWRRAGSATTALLRSIAFADERVAVAVGDDGTVVRSEDEGRTWRRVESGTSAALRGVAFDDGATGVAVGGDDRRWRARRVILRTTDAGLTWQSMDVPSGDRLYGVVRASGGFVAVGAAGCVVRSTDEGQSWLATSVVDADQPCPNLPAPADRAPWLSSVASAGELLVAAGDGGRLYWNEASRDWRGPPPLTVPNLTVAPIATAAGDAVVVAHGAALVRSERGGRFERMDRLGNFNVLVIRFIDDDIGVAAGANGGMLRTVDGGRTWSGIESPTGRYLVDIAFMTPLLGIAVGGDSGQGATVILTSDGGLTWQAHACPAAMTLCASRQPLSAIDVRPSGAGMAVGPRILIATTDGGRTWTEREQHEAFVTLTDVAVLDDRTAVVTGGAGTILRTTDAGASWTRVLSGTRVGLTSVAFADPDRGLIVGHRGVILATTDGGRTWRRDPVRIPATLVDLVINPAGTALIAGTQNVVVRRPWR